MRQKVSILLFFLLIAFFSGKAQVQPNENLLYFDEDSVYISQFDTLKIEQVLMSGQWDHLTIISDERIADLLDIQKEESIRKGGVDGFRVQIYQGTKDEAFRLKAAFMQKHPEYRVYILFRTPDFRVRVGDFRTRSEAIKLRHKIQRDFPNPFIVEDVINFPELLIVNTK